MNRSEFCSILKGYIDDESESKKAYLRFAVEFAKMIGQEHNPDVSRILDISHEEGQHSDFYQQLYDQECRSSGIFKMASQHAAERRSRLPSPTDNNNREILRRYQKKVELPPVSSTEVFGTKVSYRLPERKQNKTSCDTFCRYYTGMPDDVKIPQTWPRYGECMSRCKSASSDVFREMKACADRYDVYKYEDPGYYYSAMEDCIQEATEANKDGE